MALEDLKRIYEDKKAKIVAEERHVKTLQSQQVVSDTIVESVTSLIRYLEGKISKTEVMNQIEGFATSEDALKIVTAIILLQKQVKDSQTDIKPLVDGLNAVREQIKSIPEVKFEQKDSMKVTNLSEIKFDEVVKAIKEKNLEVNVGAPVIHTEKTDTKLVESILSDIYKAVSKKPEIIKELKVTNLKEIKPTDTKEIEKKLEKGNKYLKEISEKDFGGGGSGGGRATPYQDSAGIPAFVELVDGSVPVSSSEIVTAINNLDEYAINDLEDASATVTYIGKENSEGVYIINKIDSTTGYSVTYATISNNPTRTTYALAWANRATLTYAKFSEVY